MRPLKGIIISAKKSGSRIKLESGLTVTLPYHSKMNTGEKVLVKYDFTKNRAVGILNYYDEDNIPLPTTEEKGGNDNDNDLDLELTTKTNKSLKGGEKVWHQKAEEVEEK